MEVDRHDTGVPSWVDLGTPDPDAAATFYGELFGWDVQEGRAEEGGYRMALLRGRPAAGIGPAQNPGPPFWTTYVTVDDAGAVVGKVTAAGGTVLLEPMDVMAYGRMAVFADPKGAAFSVWQPDQHHGAGIVSEPGAYTWSELLTSDVEGSKTFYGAVFGWDAVTRGEGPRAYTELQIGGRPVAGMMARPPQMPEQVPDHWGVYFNVADCEASVARIKELGGAVMMGPMDMPPGTIAAVADPQGANFNLIQPKEGMGR